MWLNYKSLSLFSRYIFGNKAVKLLAGLNFLVPDQRPAMLE